MRDVIMVLDYRWQKGEKNVLDSTKKELEYKLHGGVGGLYTGYTVYKIYDLWFRRT